MEVTARIQWRTTTAIVLAAAGTLVLTSARAEARRGDRGFKGEATLTSTGVDVNATGKVKGSAKNSDGRFDVSASHLDRKATYDVIVGGVKVAQFTTGNGGSGKARLRTNPKGRDGLLGFDPRSAGVVVRDAAGEDVLLGTLPADDDPANADKIACCVPDDHGAECEDRTADDCTAEGGTVSTATSCVPNPCDGAVPPAGGEVVCCTPDDGGSECEDRTTAECVAESGTVVAATTCDPNPCAPVPPADDVIRCCVADDSGAECEDRTSAECTSEGGVDVGAGVCAPDTCTGVTVPGGSTGEPGDDGGNDGQGGESGHGGGD